MFTFKMKEHMYQYSLRAFPNLSGSKKPFQNKLQTQKCTAVRLKTRVFFFVQDILEIWDFSVPLKLPSHEQK